MRVFGFWRTALALVPAFELLVSGNPINKRSTQVSLTSQSYSGNTLSGTVKLQNLAYSKKLTVTWANGDNWNSANTITGYYVSGPDSSGYESWAFSGTANGATQFYITYNVNNVNYYDPGNNVNYQISQPTTSSTPFQPVESLAEWLSAEVPIAQAALLRNIGSSSNTLIPKGVVIASPSTQNPDYYYQWTRDASIVIENLVNEYLKTGSYLSYIQDWIQVQQVLQHTNNPSGGFTSGGLGEPKFLVNSSPYTGGWGRPQRDGPALRAITLMKFATKYIDIDRNYVLNTVWPVIKPDLDYVASTWTQGGFDLWEELNGIHFFTMMVQYRSMVEGAVFATLIGDTTSKNTYTAPQSNMISSLQNFWNPSKKYFISMMNGGRSGIDCGSLLGSLRGNNYIFPPSDSKVLATLDGLISAFQNLYTINKSSSKVGFAIGRYPEDVYDGVGTSQAHPWFICTTTSAHTIYKALSDFTQAGAITIDSTSLSLFKRFDNNAAAGTYSLSTSAGKAYYAGLFNYADTFLGVVKQYARNNGSLSEQFSKEDGHQVGARDLTWSYESILEAIRARDLVKGFLSTTSSSTTTAQTSTTTRSSTTSFTSTTSGCAATVTVTVTVSA